MGGVPLRLGKANALGTVGGAYPETEARIGGRKRGAGPPLDGRLELEAGLNPDLARGGGSTSGFPSLILCCSLSPRQKKSKISASRKLQLKVRTGLEKASRCLLGAELEGWGGASDEQVGGAWKVLRRGRPPRAG